MAQSLNVSLSLELGKAATDLKPQTLRGHWASLGICLWHVHEVHDVGRMQFWILLHVILSISNPTAMGLEIVFCVLHEDLMLGGDPLLDIPCM